MGMFDYIYCEYPLKEEKYRDYSFQTKDFECELKQYLITKEGLLVRLEPWGETDTEKVLIEKDIEIYFYTFEDQKDNGWIEYKAEFRKGRLINLELIELRK